MPRIVKLIFTDQLSRGDGKSEETLVRRIPQLFNMKGELVAEFDPKDEKGFFFPRNVENEQ